MKKLLSVLLSAMLLLALAACGKQPATTVTSSELAPVAGVDPTVSIDDATAAVGETFTVAVRVEKNPGIISMKLALQYDNTRLELVETARQDFAGVTYGPTEKVPFIFNWIDAIHPDNTTNGVLTTLTFRVKEGAPTGATPLTLTYDPEDVFNAAWEGVVFAVRNGSVTIG